MSVVGYFQLNFKGPTTDACKGCTSLCIEGTHDFKGLMSSWVLCVTSDEYLRAQGPMKVKDAWVWIFKGLTTLRDSWFYECCTLPPISLLYMCILICVIYIFVCMFIYIYTYAHTCTYLYIYIHHCTYMYILTDIYKYMYTTIDKWIDVYIYAYIHIFIFICIHVYMYVYIDIYVYIYVHI